jgi:serine O-acetyltransferase
MNRAGEESPTMSNDNCCFCCPEPFTITADHPENAGMCLTVLKANKKNVQPMNLIPGICAGLSMEPSAVGKHTIHGRIKWRNAGFAECSIIFSKIRKERPDMNDLFKKTYCQPTRDNASTHRKQLPKIITDILDTMTDDQCFAHVGDEPIHFSTSVKEMIEKFRHVLFPGYFSEEKIDSANLVYNMGQAISQLYDILSEQIIHVLRHDCLRYGRTCSECENSGNETALKVIQTIPQIRLDLTEDIKAAYDGDPAAKSHDEIIFSYPGIYAITVYRIANVLYLLGVPQLPRIMAEYAHSQTGIDIHPGATIGNRFVIDHGTGIVIGETSIIGKNVRVYQNVTIGALSLPPNAGEALRGAKRHPTIEDDVIIYSGATILGGKTVVGARSVIGGNVWLTRSIPADTKVFNETPCLVYKHPQTQGDIQNDFQI